MSRVAQAQAHLERALVPHAHPFDMFGLSPGDIHGLDESTGYDTATHDALHDLGGSVKSLEWIFDPPHLEKRYRRLALYLHPDRCKLPRAAEALQALTEKKEHLLTVEEKPAMDGKSENGASEEGSTSAKNTSAAPEHSVDSASTTTNTPTPSSSTTTPVAEPTTTYPVLVSFTEMYCRAVLDVAKSMPPAVAQAHKDASGVVAQARAVLCALLRQGADRVDEFERLRQAKCRQVIQGLANVDSEAMRHFSTNKAFLAKRKLAREEQRKQARSTISTASAASWKAHMRHKKKKGKHTPATRGGKRSVRDRLAEDDDNLWRHKPQRRGAQQDQHLHKRTKSNAEALSSSINTT